MDKTREALDPVWDGIMSWLESQVDTLAREVNTSFQKLLQDIHGNFSL
jgi:hypothetical protein